MSDEPPQVVVIGGPNGAGKSTIAREVLHNTLGIPNFVNTHKVAAGLSRFSAERSSLPAGRIVLRHLRHIAKQRQDFAFESTLAGCGLARWLATLVEDGFVFSVLYMNLESPDLAAQRVAWRAARHGYSVATDVIARRFPRSWSNLHTLYAPLAQRSGGFCRVYDNTRATPVLNPGSRDGTRTKPRFDCHTIDVAVTTAVATAVSVVRRSIAVVEHSMTRARSAPGAIDRHALHAAARRAVARAIRDNADVETIRHLHDI